MSESLKSDPSKFEAGTSDPGDFTADAVVKFLGYENTTNEEKSRVDGLERSGKKRVEVLAASASAPTPGDQVKPTDLSNPKFNSATDPSPQGGDDSKNPVDPNVDSDGLLDPHSQGYNANIDPSVPSSVIAELVNTELASGEDSPTLDACREAYRAKRS